jgi:tetratricopeptide (TPR) repeat protein
MTNKSIFIKFQLFIDILRQTLSLKITSEDIINEYKKLFITSTNKQDTIFNIHMLHTENERLNWLEQNPEFSQIVLRLHQLNELHNLFILQKQFVTIQNQVLESSQVSLPLTVYLTEIISKNDLDIIQFNYDRFINIGIFLLSTKSLLTARNIARQAANNGLISILFEIKVDNLVHLFNIDSDRVMFRLGAVFRLESISLAPDGVRCVNLSWLTFGNYLYSLNRFKQAMDYYSYLLEKLLPEHKDRFSISRNMELIYVMNNSKNSADKSYTDALKYAKPISSVSVIDESDDQSYTQLPITYMNLPKTAAHHSTLFGNIADVYFNLSASK